MKNLIVYYSFSQNNEKLARYLVAKLHCEAMPIETVRTRSGLSIFLDIFLGRRPALKPLNRSLGVYDHVIFVAPIWAGRIASPLRSLLNRERSMLGRYSFISLCGGAPGQKEKIEKELVSLVGKKPSGHLELPLSELPGLRRDGGVLSATKYRVGPDELVTFEPQLEKFIEDNKLVETDKVF